MMRLQKFIAESGIASRRKAEELIKQGRVKVNGETITEMGYKVDIDSIVEVDGKKVSVVPDKVYIMLNKPPGYVTTVKDQFGRPAVIDLVDGMGCRVYPVGRLDYDTSGLLILTNDGEFTYRLTHPSHNIDKVYIAEVRGVPDKNDLDQIRKGIVIEDYLTSPAKVSILSKKPNSSILKITIHEGRNRQVRKMCEAIGHPVIHLKRIAVGPLELGDLPEGKWRYLTEDEVRNLKNL